MSVGRFVWYDLMSSDPSASLEFLGKLLGIRPKETQGDDRYIELQKGEHPFAGLMKSPDGQSYWLGYIEVADLARATARAKELGAKTHMEMHEIPNVGRFTMMQDPQGAWVHLFQGNEPMPEPSSSVDGTVCWAELHTQDVKGSTDFYRQLLGWEPKTVDLPGFTYHMFGHDNKDVAGMLPKRPEDNSPTAWLFYFMVPSVDEFSKKAVELGSKPLAPPTDVGQMGRMAVLTDPTGAVFALWAMMATARS